MLGGSPTLLGRKALQWTACLGLVLCGAQPVLAQEGATTKRELPAVRFSTPPVIDGDLSDACWQSAARAERFTDALFGNPVQDQTVALLGYDGSHLYVAFHALDSQPSGIVARETKRGA